MYLHCRLTGKDANQQKANVLADKQESLALPLDSSLDDELFQDESMYAKLLTQGGEGTDGGVSRSRPIPMLEKRSKQHVQRKVPPSMIIQIEKKTVVKMMML